MPPQYKNNIRKMYRRSTEQDRIEGLKWYISAYGEAIRLSERYRTTVEEAAKTIAILSPGVKWEVNLVDAEIMLANWRAGQLIDDFPVSTYRKNKQKAWQYLTESIEYKQPTVSGFKTYNFYLNILHPEQALGVTVDRHAYRVAIGKPRSGSVALSKTLYRTVSQAYATVAREVGILPHELQAVVWCAYRRLYVSGV